jgi:ribosomal-protein-alanine N-acetyltransferase
MTISRASVKPGDLFKYLPVIETDRLKLRKLSLSDVSDVFEYASDPEVSKTVWWEHHRKVDDSLSFLKQIVFQYEKGIPSPWAVVLKQAHKMVGTIGYHWWSLENACAEVGYVISRSYWNNGYMTEALKEVLGFGFDKMSLERVEAKCFIENLPSERVMQKCGMKLEGILRNSMFVKGEFRNFKIYSILRDEFYMPGTGKN